MSASIIVPESPPHAYSETSKTEHVPAIGLSSNPQPSKRGRPSVLYFPFNELAEVRRTVEPWFTGTAISTVSSLGTSTNYLVTLRNGKDGHTIYTLTDPKGVRHIAQSIEERRARELIEHIGERGSVLLFNLIKRGRTLPEALADVLEGSTDSASASQTQQGEEAMDSSAANEEEQRLARAEECSARNMGA